MEIIAIILSGLALLAVGVCMYLLAQEKKRSQERNVDMCNYVDAALLEAKGFAKKLGAEADERIGKLEQGITPDYEQAKAAADAVNDFNQSISNILGFDPMVALQAGRQKERMGEAK